MTARRLALVALAAAAAAGCNGDRAPQKPAPAVPAAPADPAGPAAAASADSQCLPLNVCDQWSGCALIARTTTGWTVIAADRFAPGDPVDVTSVCTSGASCTAVRGIPSGVRCPDWSTPPYIAPPSYRCAWDGKTCHRA
jgi:hypothetical protein